jgi:hypothetical protein
MSAALGNAIFAYLDMELCKVALSMTVLARPNSTHIHVPAMIGEAGDVVFYAQHFLNQGQVLHS